MGRLIINQNNIRLTGFLAFMLSLGMVNRVQAIPEGYQLVWSDEFHQPENSSPDPGKWVYDLGASGWGNQELEKYTDEPGNAYVTSDPHALNGKALVLKAIREADGSYTSARIKTKGKFSFQYGWVEARLKLPYGQGIWPAFWLLGADIDEVGWPNCGEIDIMESIGKELPVIHGTIHGPGYSGDKGPTSIYALPNGKAFRDDYHTFAIEWSAGKISFYVDNHLYKVRTPEDLPKGKKWVYDHPFFIILNLAVGGEWPGYPDSSTVFPQTLAVDYVRVYQRP